MKRILSLLTALAVVSVASVGLTDGTITETVTGLGSIKISNLAWNSLTNQSTANIVLNGEISRVTFVPAATASANYDVTIKDADGFDILGGLGANLASNTVVNIAPGVPVTDATAGVTNMQPMVASGTYTVLADNTGVSTGTVKVYYKP